MQRRLLLRNRQASGDVLMLTAAVRDLVRTCPGEFLVVVRSSSPEVWENNPYLSVFPESAKDVEVIECSYPAIHESNRVPMHFIGAFHAFLSERLRREIKVTAFKGDIHLSQAEREEGLPVLASLEGAPYWIVCAGGKRDFTVKWWEHRRWQEVVDRLHGKVAFVQIGGAGHYHPKLKGVIDLRGRTDLRQLIRLVHHSAGVLTTVSLPMHLAAAVETNAAMRGEGWETRPCVVVAGGREPPHWEAYPTHQFIHTVGMLNCCRTGGCWRSRTRALGDGSEHDDERRLCVNVVEGLPRCMGMITAEEVAQRVEMYLEGGRQKAEGGSEQSGAVRERAGAWEVQAEVLTIETVREAVGRAMERITSYPAERYSGKGVVMCAGGPVYLACAWVCLQMLRRTGCSLPVEVWYRGETEFPPVLHALYEGLGAQCVDATRVRRRYPMRRLGGWELKAFAILHSSFEEVFFIDADNVPLVDPATLLELPQYRRHGAILWPDLGKLTRESAIWELCGIEPRDEPEVESGQMLLHKKRCWAALSLALWMNEHSDFFYEHMHGDKETFHLAFRRVGKSFAMPRAAPVLSKGTLNQHGFDGCVTFQHRNLAKWCPWGNNRRDAAFRLEGTCLRYLRALGKNAAWREYLGRIPVPVIGAAKPHTPAAGVTIRSPLNAYTGYGLHTCAMANGFREMGVQVALRPTVIQEQFAPVPEEIRQMIADGEDSAEWELLLHPPNVAPRPNRKTLFFTMWETTRLPSKLVRNLNRAECVIVPCRWNAESFRACGVTRPIHVLPLGIKAELFRYAPMKMSGPCVFGAGGRLRDSDPKRKRVDETIELFQKAFPAESDVELWVKIFPDCPIQRVSDPRVTITQRYMTEEELAGWFRGLTCFVSSARSEGWGLMQHQALATGRPIISTRYGGVAEYFSTEMGYEISFTVRAAEGKFAGCGEWAEPSRAEIVAAMQRVYCNRDEARILGKLGAKKVKRLSWANANAKLAKLLRKVGALPRT